ncbi:MAG: metallophosphoesterase [Candidatus Nanohaloarchaea archaeon]
MKLGIVSDSHDHFEKAKEAADFFEVEGVKLVIHCGDMICPATAEIFDRNFEFYYVRGNNDGEWNLKQAVQDFGKFSNNIMELELEGKEIAVYHGTEEEIVNGLVDSGDYDYVFRGHTHRKKIREKDGTVELNPGGVKLPFQEEKIHVIVLDLKSGEFEFHRIEV